MDFEYNLTNIFKINTGHWIVVYCYGNMCCCQQRGVYVICATLPEAGRTEQHRGVASPLKCCPQKSMEEQQLTMPTYVCNFQQKLLFLAFYLLVFVSRTPTRIETSFIKYKGRQVWRTFETERQYTRTHARTWYRWDTRYNRWSCPVEWTWNVWLLYIYFALDSKQCRRLCKCIYYINVIYTYIFIMCDYQLWSALFYTDKGLPATMKSSQLNLF